MCQHNTIEFLICLFSLSILDFLQVQILENIKLFSVTYLTEECCCFVTYKKKKQQKKCLHLSIIAKSEVTQANCKCFLGQKVIWHLSLVKKWDQGSKPSAPLHLRGAGEGQL